MSGKKITIEDPFSFIGSGTPRTLSKPNKLEGKKPGKLNKNTLPLNHLQSDQYRSTSDVHETFKGKAKDRLKDNLDGPSKGAHSSLESSKFIKKTYIADPEHTHLLAAIAWERREEINTVFREMMAEYVKKNAVSKSTRERFEAYLKRQKALKEESANTSE